MTDQERLRECMDYDPLTGIFIWKYSRSNRVKAGDEAGWNADKGYRGIRFQGKECKAHRLAWLYVYGELPTNEIDHINGIKNDNRIANLRNVTHQENTRNIKRRNSNTSGVMGICWDRQHKKWLVRIGGKHVGRYADFDLALLARSEAEKSHGYHPNHGRIA